MKSVLQNVKTGQITVEDIPQPVIKPGIVLVRNVCSLVSAGTEKSILEFSQSNYFKKARLRPDLFRKVLNRVKNEGLLDTYKVVHNLIDQPIPLGYSSAGIVLELGHEISDLHAGQKVACAGLFCATHSEIVGVPRNLVVPIPDEVDYEEAAFVTLGAIAMQAVREAELSIGESVLVLGLGLVGMITAQLAVAAGCKVIGLDIDPRKVEQAHEFGCYGVESGEGAVGMILGLTDQYGVDKVLLCAATKSNDPIEQIPRYIRQKGLLVVVGDVPMNIPRRAYYDKEIDIKISRSYGPGRYDLSYEEGGSDYPYAYVRWTENRNMQSIIDLIARKRLNVKSLITHRFPIEAATRAYDLIEGHNQQPYQGILIQYCDEKFEIPVRKAVFHPMLQGKTTKICLGVVGAGNFAKAFLLPVFQNLPDVRFKAVCTASGVSAASVAKKYKMEMATSEPEDIFSDQEINAVIIATRHDSHAKYVQRAMQSGKAVFVEKPLAISWEDLQSIQSLYDALVQKNKAPFLMVGFNRRFSPLASIMKESFSHKKEPLSIIYRVNAGFVAANDWIHNSQIGGGRIVGECCHFIDFLSFLLDENPISLSAGAIHTNPNILPDIVSITLNYPGKSMGTIHYYANGHSSMPKEYVEVFCGGVCSVLNNFKSVKIYGANAPGKKWYMNQKKGFQQEVQAFVDALINGNESPIPFSQIYTTTKATLWVEEALRTGKRVEL